MKGLLHVFHQGGLGTLVECRIPFVFDVPSLISSFETKEKILVF